MAKLFWTAFALGVVTSLMGVIAQCWLNEPVSPYGR